MNGRKEKPALNISKIAGGKNEKARLGLDVKKFGYELKSKQLNM